MNYLSWGRDAENCFGHFRSWSGVCRMQEERDSPIHYAAAFYERRCLADVHANCPSWLRPCRIPVPVLPLEAVF